MKTQRASEGGIVLDIKDQTETYSRLIGNYGGDIPGPTIIAIGGMHGNEPSGVEALEYVFKKLNKLKPSFKGEIIGIRGNLKALQSGKRYLDTDLNRLWKMRPNMEDLVSPEETREKEEFTEIQAYIEKTIASRKGPLIFLDLHTTSAESPPFILIGDTLRNRKFVSKLGLPVVLGVEEQLDGPCMSYINATGHIAIGFEAGEHRAASSVKNHKCLVWNLLARAGCLSEDALPDIQSSRKWLKTQVDGIGDDFFEVRLRYGITPEDAFKMKKGYLNFQAIDKGEKLARDHKGDVVASDKGFIFMPLYQSQGDDGFFIVRKIAPFWLKTSIVLRKAGLHKILPILPGVKKQQVPKGALEMNTSIAKFLGTQLMHLLGYRRINEKGDKKLFIKRRFDLRGPSEIDRFRL